MLRDHLFGKDFIIVTQIITVNVRYSYMHIYCHYLRGYMITHNVLHNVADIVVKGKTFLMGCFAPTALEVTER